MRYLNRLYHFLFFPVFILFFISLGNSQSYEKEVKVYQQGHLEKFLNPEESPLPQDEIKNFKGHLFFPINNKYRVEANFVRTPNAAPFKMKTTTSRRPVYLKYGEAHFKLNDQEYVLSLYQNIRDVEDGDTLFLPFTDLTNGISSYANGRYMDVKIPEGDIIVLDFNKTYNPYCAYSPYYSCVLPPEENKLSASIDAGIMKPKNKH